MTYVIPAIDIINGECVRLSKGNYSTKIVYNQDPLLQAKIFADMGFTKLHIVDLDGARLGKPQNLQVLEKIAKLNVFDIDFGGGLRTEKNFVEVFKAGAKQVTVGSLAFKNPELFVKILNKFGSEKIIFSADVNKKQIAYSAWQINSNISIFDWLEKNQNLNLKYIMVTDISKDGLLLGPNYKIYQELKVKYPSLNIIASGGVANRQDVEKLQALGLYGVIVGKALYEEKYFN